MSLVRHSLPVNLFWSQEFFGYKKKKQVEIWNVDFKAVKGVIPVYIICQSFSNPHSPSPVQSSPVHSNPLDPTQETTKGLFTP